MRSGLKTNAAKHSIFRAVKKMRVALEPLVSRGLKAIIMHLNEDDLILHYYGELNRLPRRRMRSHLRECAACQCELHHMQRVLAAVNAAPRSNSATASSERCGHGCSRSSIAGGSGWLSWFVLSPARLAWVAGIVMLVAAAFFAGRVSRPAVPARIPT